jgi:hypothetical protein
VKNMLATSRKKNSSNEKRFLGVQGRPATGPPCLLNEARHDATLKPSLAAMHFLGNSKTRARYVRGSGHYCLIGADVFLLISLDQWCLLGRLRCRQVCWHLTSNDPPLGVYCCALSPPAAKTVDGAVRCASETGGVNNNGEKLNF